MRNDKENNFQGGRFFKAASNWLPQVMVHKRVIANTNMKGYSNNLFGGDGECRSEVLGQY